MCGNRRGKERRVEGRRACCASVREDYRPKSRPTASVLVTNTVWHLVYKSIRILMLSITPHTSPSILYTVCGIISILRTTAFPPVSLLSREELCSASPVQMSFIHDPEVEL